MTRSSGPAYGWVIVAAGALMTCVSMGSMFSLAVFLQPMSADNGWSRTGISTAMTISFLAMAVASFLWGALSDRFGPRIVVLCGSLMLGLGLVLASDASSLVEFQLLFGLFIGAAAGAFYAPMMALASAWFDQNRSLAVALVSAGGGMASLTVAPFARLLIDAYSWRPAMLMRLQTRGWSISLPLDNTSAPSWRSNMLKTDPAGSPAVISVTTRPMNTGISESSSATTKPVMNRPMNRPLACLA